MLRIEGHNQAQAFVGESVLPAKSSSEPELSPVRERMRSIRASLYAKDNSVSNLEALENKEEIIKGDKQEFQGRGLKKQGIKKSDKADLGPYGVNLAELEALPNYEENFEKLFFSISFARHEGSLFADSIESRSGGASGLDEKVKTDIINKVLYDYGRDQSTINDIASSGLSVLIGDDVQGSGAFVNNGAQPYLLFDIDSLKSRGGVSASDIISRELTHLEDALDGNQDGNINSIKTNHLVDRAAATIEADKEGLRRAGFAEEDLNRALSDDKEMLAVLKQFYQNDKDLFEVYFKDLDNAWDLKYGKDEYAL